MYIEESFDTIFNVGYGSVISPIVPKKLPFLLFSHIEWMDRINPSPLSIKYKGKKQPIKSRVKREAVHFCNANMLPKALQSY